MGTMHPDKQKLRNAVRFFYDLQKLRIETLNRQPKGGDAPELELDDGDVKFIQTTSDGLRALERGALRHVDRVATRFSAYDWLKSVKGVGPTTAGFLLAEFDIVKAERPSQFWSFAGLSVVNGSSPRPQKGQKLPYNSWLRSKCIAVVGGCLLKAANETYRPIYDDYKHRKAHTFTDPCMLCNGSGLASQPKKDQDGKVSKEAGEKKKCWNCDGAGKGPWGKGDAHRHQAALRYMVKMFLADFWRAWREAENLPVVAPYHEAVLGHKHHE